MTAVLAAAFCLGFALPQRAAGAPQHRFVVVNGERLDDRTLAALEQYYRVRITNGRYWYDRYCGAWGVEGGPTRGFVLADLDVGGRLRRDASNGNTGVFVNGRELHWQDVRALQRITPVYRGRYWLNARGDGGYEGGPKFFNLRDLAAQAGVRNTPWSYTSKYFGSVGGDGNFVYYISSDSSMTSQ